VKACEHAVERRDFMESSQCLEDLPSTATITQELCLPSREGIIRHIASTSKQSGIKNVFVASDIDPDIAYLQRKLGTEVSVLVPYSAKCSYYSIQCHH